MALTFVQIAKERPQMIKYFFGDDRVRAQKEIKKLLGDDYEIIEGPEITPSDLPSIFYGTTLFNPTRRILIRDLSANKAVYLKLEKYLDTPHQVIILDLKLDQRTITFKSLKDKIEFTKFTLPEDPNTKKVFDIFRVAKTDGKKAVSMLQELKITEDPIKFTGLLISQAIKDYTLRQGTKEKQVLKALSKLDIAEKSTKTDPWPFVEAFLISLSSIK